ncbi:DUF1365 domain-containing protein [Streptomyces sp. NBC_01443]|uniref:DUF1365 domain-containing protein n=1 Tax=Streptomyces sp. NBC_01443 TaxID=2903868 RepID=UPI00225BDA6D|nr:DUF1365 domain-containing protein [Streptomyces sp. NBC_01443]MCX4625716.1 DUF1365 domain-containing protein [Streptomyces sp. NBC_01443]WSW41762.1 DUF1365 domain-containing protein [Streptomyces sp. NBC_01001]
MVTPAVARVVAPGAAPGTSPAHPAVAVPALYDCVVSHARTAPVRHAFRHRTYMWLVDLDALPRLPWPLRPLARFDARDHFDAAAPTVRAGLEAYLASRDVHLDGGRVLMLAHARVLGYVFNPLTLYWCHDRSGALVCVVAEVHNTYGQRHCHLLRTDGAGRAEAAKELYVSPFFPVDGRYRMRLPEPREQLEVTVQLERAGQRPFTATLRGRHRPATPLALLRAAARRPWSTAAVWAGIRRHGIHLLLRGLPVQPRPDRAPEEGIAP